MRRLAFAISLYEISNLGLHNTAHKTMPVWRIYPYIIYLRFLEQYWNGTELSHDCSDYTNFEVGAATEHTMWHVSLSRG